MFCPKCGTQLPDGAKFCTSCGASLGGTTQPVDYAPTATRGSISSNSGIVAAGGTSASMEWHPATTPELGGPARRIMTNRGLIKYLLFSFLTFGIYSFYFIYKMAQDMNTMCEDDDQKTGGLIAFILLNFITFGIYGIYWWYKIANRVHINAPRYGLIVTEKGSTFLLWWLLGLVTFGIAALFGFHIVIKNVNALAIAYNHKHNFI